MTSDSKQHPTPQFFRDGKQDIGAIEEALLCIIHFREEGIAKDDLKGISVKGDEFCEALILLLEDIKLIEIDHEKKTLKPRADKKEYWENWTSSEAIKGQQPCKGLADFFIEWFNENPSVQMRYAYDAIAEVVNTQVDEDLSSDKPVRPMLPYYPNGNQAEIAKYINQEQQYQKLNNERKEDKYKDTHFGSTLNPTQTNAFNYLMVYLGLATPIKLSGRKPWCKLDPTHRIKRMLAEVFSEDTTLHIGTFMHKLGERCVLLENSSKSYPAIISLALSKLEKEDFIKLGRDTDHPAGSVEIINFNGINGIKKEDVQTIEWLKGDLRCN